MNEAPEPTSVVLVVDDDPDLCELVELVGSSIGVKVLSAPDCGKAVEILRRERSRVRLVLLDYLLPEGDPPKCAAAMRANSMPGTRVVLCTAAGRAAQRAAELHLDGSLAKPFLLDDLEAKLLAA